VGETGDGLQNRLKEYRVRRNLTQEQLAGQIGVSRKTVNTVENGVFIPSTVLALKMAKALRAPVEELFFLTENSIETSL
jgi:putative transcriptional regulator